MFDYVLQDVSRKSVASRGEGWRGISAHRLRSERWSWLSEVRSRELNLIESRGLCLAAIPVFAMERILRRFSISSLRICFWSTEIDDPGETRYNYVTEIMIVRIVDRAS